VDDRGDARGVVLAFTGTYSNDSAAIVGVAGSHVFVVDAWESDNELGIDRARVAASLKEAIGKYRPRRIVCNPIGWIAEVNEWTETYGSTVVTFDWTHQHKRKADACTRFYSAVLDRKLTHDGDVRMSRHLSAAVVKETPEGAYITKGGRESPRKVELAVAAVMAFDQVKPEAEVLVAWD
jgi:phage terminase large subunit-like protein